MAVLYFLHIAHDLNHGLCEAYSRPCWCFDQHAIGGSGGWWKHQQRREMYSIICQRRRDSLHSPEASEGGESPRALDRSIHEEIPPKYDVYFLRWILFGMTPHALKKLPPSRMAVLYFLHIAHDLKSWAIWGLFPPMLVFWPTCHRGLVAGENTNNGGNWALRNQIYVILSF